MIRHALPLLVIAALAGGAAAEDASPAERADRAREALIAEAQDLRVSGGAVGRGGQPGRFCLLTRDLAAGAERAELLALLQHEAAIPRAAAMVALVQRFPAEAPQALRPRFSSTVTLGFQPQGCSVGEIQEGELALRLLLAPDLLGFRTSGQKGAAKPLVQVPVKGKEKPALRFRWARAALAVQRDPLVSGFAVGFGAQPGRFYVLLRELVATGDRDDLRALLAHDALLVRAAGIVALAHLDPEGAPALLEPLAKSKRALTLLASGCCAEKISEGQLVQRALAKPNLLGPLR